MNRRSVLRGIAGGLTAATAGVAAIAVPDLPAKSADDEINDALEALLAAKARKHGCKWQAVTETQFGVVIVRPVLTKGERP